MGGRGTSSYSGGISLNSGNKAADSILRGLVKEFQGITPDNKRKEALAKVFLNKYGSNPISGINEASKSLVQQYNNNIKELKNYKAEIAKREELIRRETKILKSYSKETRTVTNVRGQKVQTNSKRYEVQASKVTMLNKGLSNYHREISVKEKSIKNFKENYTNEMRRIVKAGMLAKGYKKR